MEHRAKRMTQRIGYSRQHDGTRNHLHDFFNPFVKAEDLTLPEGEAAWCVLLEMAESSRQLPLLAKRLEPFEIPLFVRDRLRWAKSRCIAISAMHQDSIHKMSVSFTEREIKFQVLKGIYCCQLQKHQLVMFHTC